MEMTKPFADDLDRYFDSYSHAGIHEEMIKDEVRTNTYRDAILKNSHLFKDKIVLDIGCGTGILSLFAAKAGAKKVIGVDMSSIARYALKIVKLNNYENIITIINGSIEEINLPVNNVDIIISEWMGYGLLFESMIDTVIYARDKWLCKNGLIFPDIANIYICGIEDAYYKEEKIDWWDNVYGFKMNPIKELALCEPFVDYVESKFVTTTYSKLCTIDLKTIKTHDLLKYFGKFTLNISEDNYIHAFILYFDVVFSACHTPIILTTSPYTPYTHWKHTIFYLHEFITACKNEKITGSLIISQNSINKRHLDYKLVVDFDGKISKLHEENMYYMR